MRPPFRDFPLSLRIILMFVLFFFNIILISMLALALLPALFGISDTTTFLSSVPETLNEINAFLFVQAFSSIGGFIFTALAFAQLQAGNAGKELSLNVKPSLKMLALAIFCIVAAQFFIQFIVEVNTKIQLPTWLGFLNDSQKQAEDIINAVLDFKRPGQFIAVTIVFAVIPAVAEEMFFRGLLLGSLLKGKVSPVLSIVLTGLIFSLSHMEFNNTLAIWVLGAFLGYLYYVSGSLWLPIAAHFTNNFLDVLVKYLYNTGHISNNLAEAQVPVYATIISFLIFVCCIFLFNKWKVQPSIEPEEDPIDFNNQSITE